MENDEMQDCPELKQMNFTLSRIDNAAQDIQNPRKAGKVAYMRAQYVTAIAKHKRKCKVCKANAAPVATAADVALIPTAGEEAE